MIKKTYVEVDVKFDTHGNIFPLKIIWKNGEEFLIDRVIDKKSASSMKAGGNGIRYTIRINGNTTYLWYEEPSWFVEEKING